MNLWWLITSNSKCSYEELKYRQSICIGWPELESLERYIKDKPNWERQFKTFVQLRGNLAYQRDKNWTAEDQSINSGVPNIFWNLLNIRKGDFITVMETGNQMTLGNIEVRGIAKVTQNAISSYKYNNQFHHAHQVCEGLTWLDWNLAKFGELVKPKQSFKSILIDNGHLSEVKEAWEVLVK